MNIFKNDNGNAFIEYFVLALIVLAATIAFFDQGNFMGARQDVENVFTKMIQEVAQ